VRLKVRLASGTQDGTGIFIGIGRRRRAPAPAENFANFRQFHVLQRALALKVPKPVLLRLG